MEAVFWETQADTEWLVGYTLSNPHERKVGKSPTESRRHAVGHKKGLAVLRQVGVPCGHRMLPTCPGRTSHIQVSGHCDNRLLVGALCCHSYLE